MAQSTEMAQSAEMAQSTEATGGWIGIWGSWFETFLQPLLDFIYIPSVGPGVALVVVVGAIIVLGLLIIDTAVDWLLVKKADSCLGESRGLEAFAKNYNVINEDMGDIRKVNRAWREFNETLIPPTKEEMTCSNTVRPHDYFNLTDLNVGPRFFKIFPNIFVGIGLALTFLGLISALTAAVSTVGADVNDTAQIAQGIGDLLRAASAKFYASLFALVSSIVLTFVIRGSTKLVSDAVRKLNESIEQGVQYISSERIALDSNRTLENQLRQLETFNTDLAMQIGEQILNSLGPVITKIEKLGDGVGEAQLDTIRQIGKEITTQIGSATTDSMVAVASKLDEVSDKLGGLTDSLTGALSNFDGEFKTILQGLHNSLEESTQEVATGLSNSLGTMTTEIGGTTQAITATVGGLQTTVENLAGVGKEITEKGGEAIVQSVEAAAQAASEIISSAGQGMAEGFRTSTADMTTSLGEAAGVAKESIANAGQGMADGIKVSTTNMTTSFGDAAQNASGIITTAGQEVAKGFKTSTAEMTAAAESASKTFSNAGSSMAEGFKTSTTEMTTAAERASKTISNAGSSMATSFTAAADEMIPALNTTVEQLKSLQTGFTSLPAHLQEINQSLANGARDLIQASQQFSTASGNLKDLVEPLATYAKETRTAITETTETFERVAGLTDSSSTRIADAVDKLHDEVSKQVQRLDGSDEILGKLLVDLQNHADALITKTNVFVTKVDSGFNSSIGALEESIIHFEDVVNKFTAQDNPPEE